jgi:hypothetical protein
MAEKTSMEVAVILKCGIMMIAYGSRWHGQRDPGAKGVDRLVDSADCDDI